MLLRAFGPNTSDWPWRYDISEFAEYVEPGIHLLVTDDTKGGVLRDGSPAVLGMSRWSRCGEVRELDGFLRADALSTAGAYIDGFVINRGLPTDRIYASTWNTPMVETNAPDNGDGNVTGQIFDFAGPSILPRHGRFFESRGILYQQ